MFKSPARTALHVFCTAAITVCMIGAAHGSDESNQARQAYAAGKFQLAKEKYSTALKSEIDAASRALILANIACCLREGKNFDEAETTFKESLVAAKNVDSKTKIYIFKQYAALLRKMHRDSDSEAAEIAAEQLLRPNWRMEHAMNMARLQAWQQKDVVAPTNPGASTIPPDAIAMASASRTSSTMAPSGSASSSQGFTSGDPIAMLLEAIKNYQKKTGKVPSIGATYTTQPQSYPRLAMKPDKAQERFHRFKNEEMPIRVYIPQLQTDTSMLSGKSRDVLDASYSALVTSAFNEWGQASCGAVRFKFVDLGEVADIHCTWVNQQTSVSETESAAVGVTRTGRMNNDKGVGREIKLLSIDPRTGRSYSKECFHEVCLHEIGHALGLEHSGEPEDVMYPYTHNPGLPYLSSNDTQRILELYRQN